MAEQEQRRPRRKEAETGAVEEKGASTESIEEIDDLLDEIDSVLEENAEEFVKNYVQKGGE